MVAAKVLAAEDARTQGLRRAINGVAASIAAGDFVTVNSLRSNSLFSDAHVYRPLLISLPMVLTRDRKALSLINHLQ